MPLHNPFVPIAGANLRYSDPSTLAADQDLIPGATDTYDLGSPLRLYRKGYLSELDAVLFAQNTITLLGGWLYITRDEGTLAADVLAADTTIDFGKVMTVGHFVIFRAALKVEYVQVGALVSGTTYSVTRNLDGSGANDWAAGTPFCVLGTTGDGRIELNAYDTPRVSITEQGATYNAQTERMRLGDLAGWQSAGLTGYGWAVGNFAGGKYAYYNPTDGLIVRGIIRADAGYLGTLSIDGVLSIGASGEIRQGTGTLGVDFTGLRVWRDSGIGRIAGYNGGALQWQADTDGKLYAGAGAVRLDANGIKFLGGTAGVNQIGWGPAGFTPYCYVYGDKAVGPPILISLAGRADVANDIGNTADIGLTAYGGDNAYRAILQLHAAASDGVSCYGQLQINGVTAIDARETYVAINPPLRVGTNPAASGIIRIPNNQWINARKADNSGDVNLIQLDANNMVVVAPQATITYPVTGASLALSWNQSSGLAEVDFWNTYNNPNRAFGWLTKTGAATFASLMTLSGTGGLAPVAGFGCNGKAAQTAYASGGLLAGVVAALVANGILSN
ncbi:MAG: hypothetical protein ACYC4L_11455 [Chloroflexota bacterium]